MPAGSAASAVSTGPAGEGPRLREHPARGLVVGAVGVHEPGVTVVPRGAEGQTRLLPTQTRGEGGGDDGPIRPGTSDEPAPVVDPGVKGPGETRVSRCPQPSRRAYRPGTRTTGSSESVSVETDVPSRRRPTHPAGGLPVGTSLGTCPVGARRYTGPTAPSSAGTPRFGPLTKVTISRPRWGTQ